MFLALSAEKVVPVVCGSAVSTFLSEFDKAEGSSCHGCGLLDLCDMIVRLVAFFINIFNNILGKILSLSPCCFYIYYMRFCVYSENHMFCSICVKQYNFRRVRYLFLCCVLVL